MRFFFEKVGFSWKFIVNMIQYFKSKVIKLKKELNFH